MKKQLVILGIAVLFLVVGLSGCNEIIPSAEKKLSDGTSVSGDIGQIQISEYNFSKLKKVYWNSGYQTYRLTYSDEFYPAYDGVVPKGNGEAEAPWDLDVGDIENDSNKKRELYLNYIHSNEEDWLKIQQANIPIELYTGFVTSEYAPSFGSFKYFYEVQEVWNFRLDDNIICDIVGTAKNIGDSFLDYTRIVVNFYNINGSWSASKSDSENNIPVGYTWDFNIRYDGEFSNDVSYISFEVDASLYDN